MFFPDSEPTINKMNSTRYVNKETGLFVPASKPRARI
jgi:hypothetical protein